MNRGRNRFFLLILLSVGLFFAEQSDAQVGPPTEDDIPVLPVPSMEEIAKRWGPNDTVYVDAIWYRNEVMSFKELPMVWVSKLSPEKLAKWIEEWTRLRNAVYVTYPYAIIAGTTINDINAHTSTMKSKKERKAYIKSREKDLKTTFGDPISNLSVYQGKILMKLINRQTGNNCYEIIKEYRGGITARFYQTVAFFFGSSMKQDWDLADRTDRQIENIVKEIDASWYNNPYRK
jgi:hypothetical protein